MDLTDLIGAVYELQKEAQGPNPLIQGVQKLISGTGGVVGSVAGRAASDVVGNAASRRVGGGLLGGMARRFAGNYANRQARPRVSGLTQSANRVVGSLGAGQPAQAARALGGFARQTGRTLGAFGSLLRQR